VNSWFATLTKDTFHQRILVSRIAEQSLVLTKEKKGTSVPTVTNYWERELCVRLIPVRYCTSTVKYLVLVPGVLNVYHIPVKYSTYV
jgi:hypothetical protein